MDSEFNIYKAPEGDLSIPQAAVAEPILFSTSTPKLIVMYLCSFCFYGLYWFYKNWDCISTLEKRPYFSVIRAIFSVISSYDCFKKIFEEADRYDIKVFTPAWLLALIYALLNLSSKAPVSWYLLSFASFLPLIPANIAARKVNEHCIEGFKKNSYFSRWNWLPIVPGGIF